MVGVILAAPAGTSATAIVALPRADGYEVTAFATDGALQATPVVAETLSDPTGDTAGDQDLIDMTVDDALVTADVALARFRQEARLAASEWCSTV